MDADDPVFVRDGKRTMVAGEDYDKSFRVFISGEGFHGSVDVLQIKIRGHITDLVTRGYFAAAERRKQEQERNEEEYFFHGLMFFFKDKVSRKSDLPSGIIYEIRDKSGYSPISFFSPAASSSPS
jgi:hypothetical protein